MKVKPAMSSANLGNSGEQTASGNPSSLPPNRHNPLPNAPWQSKNLSFLIMSARSSGGVFKSVSSLSEVSAGRLNRLEGTALPHGAVSAGALRILLSHTFSAEMGKFDRKILVLLAASRLYCVA